MSKTTKTKTKTSAAEQPKEWRIDWLVNYVAQDSRSDATAEIDVTPPGHPAFKLTLAPAILSRPPRAVDEIINRCGVVPKDRKALEHLVKHATTEATPHCIVRVIRTGWFDGAFVTPAAVYPPPGRAVNVVFDQAFANRHSSLRALGQRRGTLARWKRRVAKLVGYSSSGVVVIGAALAAVLLDFADITETFIINLAGPSSGGKTTLEVVAMSVQGVGDRQYLQSPVITARGLSDLGHGFNCLLLVFDDMGRIEETAKVRHVQRNLAYQLTSFNTRTVADKSTADGLASDPVRLIAVTSFEKTSVEEAKAQNTTKQLGETVRFFDLPSKKGEEGGVFDLKPEDCTLTTEDLVHKINRAASLHYGVALPAFIAWLQNLTTKEKRKAIRDHTKAFVERFAPGEVPIRRRAAAKFGLIYAALMMGRSADVIDWDEAHISRAVGMAYQAAMSVSSTAQTGSELLKRLKALLHEEGRVVTTRGGTLGGEPTDDCLAIDGVRHGGQRLLGLREQRINQMFANALDRGTLMQELVRQGLVVRDGDKLNTQVRLKLPDDKAFKPRLILVKRELLKAV